MFVGLCQEVLCRGVSRVRFGVCGSVCVYTVLEQKGHIIPYIITIGQY